MTFHRIRRWSLFLAVVAFVCCLALTALRFLSERHDFWWQASLGHSIHALKIRGGLVSLYQIRQPARPGSPATTVGEIGIYYPIVLLALVTFIFLIDAFRRRNHVSGRCSVCGYDLRATPDRCPECGTTIHYRERPD
jgi:hypothetical protein